MRTTLLLAPLAFVFVAIPSASALCSLGETPLCDFAESSGLQDLFGDYADLVLAVVGLFLAALVLVVILSLLYKLRPQRLLHFEVGEKFREIEPGSTARFKLDLENVNRRFPVDVFLERGIVPDGWVQDLRAAVVLPSGFRIPQTLAETSSFPLTSERKGGNRAQLEVHLTSPSSQTNEETVDYELRAIPVFRGRLRKRKAKKARLTALVTPHMAQVQIVKVTHEPDRLTAGTPVLTRAFLANKGERAASDVAVKFSLNGQEIDKKIVPALGTSSETQVEFNWVPQAGENRIRVAVES